jgi:anti-sigma factor RsiW
MSCPRLEQSVFLHAHGQLDGAKGWLVETHLQHCAMCRARWAQWTVERDQLRRAFAPLPADPAGLTGLTVAVGARIRTERAFPEDLPSPARPRFSLGLAGVALAVALLAVGISALAAYWQPVVDHCQSALQLRPPGPSGTPMIENCPGLHNQPLNAPGAGHPGSPAGPVPR